MSKEKRNASPLSGTFVGSAINREYFFDRGKESEEETFAELSNKYSIMIEEEGGDPVEILKEQRRLLNLAIKRFKKNK